MWWVAKYKSVQVLQNKPHLLPKKLFKTPPHLVQGLQNLLAPRAQTNARRL